MSETNPMRADAALCARGLAASRERAQELISAGLAWCDGSVIKKAAQKVAPDALLEVRGECCPYVSRGGFKLAHALDAFGVDPEALVCLDVGASTGGFTDVLLQRGAKHVYAVDVGSGQLAPAIAADARVTSMENMNARTLTPELFPELPVLGVMDVSFISIVKILPALESEMAGAATGFPYPGAKLHAILDIDDREKALRVAAILRDVTPLPKPKRKKETAGRG